MIGAAFMLGLLGSTHCIGMCGPLALAIPLSKKDRIGIVLESLPYHFGRIATYSLLGFLFGILGQGLALSGGQKYVSIGLGIFILIAALFSFQLESTLLRNTTLNGWYTKLKKSLATLLGEANPKKRFTIGLINGFLPCGLVYFALAGAITSPTIFEGLLFMAAFGLGTLPLMVGIQLIGAIIKAPLKRKLVKASPIIMVGFGLFLIYRGLEIDLPMNFRLWAEGDPELICH